MSVLFFYQIKRQGKGLMTCVKRAEITLSKDILIGLN